MTEKYEEFLEYEQFGDYRDGKISFPSSQDPTNCQDWGRMVTTPIKRDYEGNAEEHSCNIPGGFGVGKGAFRGGRDGL